MEHVDAEVLALLALGEPASDADQAHIAACDQCAEMVASLTATARTGRTVTDADVLVAPSPEVWNRISAELGLGAGTSAAGSRADAAPDVTPEPRAAVVPLRRRPAPWLVAAAAAAGIVVGAAGVSLWPDAGAGAEVVAEASLDPLPGWDASGDAAVERSDDGRLTLVLHLEGTPEDEGFREVWLIDREVTRLISLGVLAGTDGRFMLPSGIDLSDFAVVDVSQEPIDGDPAHSGDSILRGVLDA